MGIHRHQSGVAFLILLLVIISAAAAAFVVRPVSQRLELGNDAQTSQLLHRAKRALLGYAMTYPEQTTNPNAGPGLLPCPDTDLPGSPGSGTANPPCNNESTGTITLGRLPWKQLGLSDNRDAGNERLWYAVASNFRNNPQLATLNSDTNNYTDLSLNSSTATMAAVIIAPGRSFDYQQNNRPSTNVLHYLEGDNANNTNKNFITTLNGDFNDRVLMISRSELMQAAETRVGQEMTSLLSSYYTSCGYYPLAAAYNPMGSNFDASENTYEGHFPIGNTSANSSADWNTGCASGLAPAAWLASNDWQKLSYYAVANTYINGGAQACGACLRLNPDPATDKQAIIILAGPDLSGNRPSINISDYFENENQSAADNIFETGPITSSFNDQVITLP